MIPHYLRNHENDLKNFSLHFDKFSQWDIQPNMKARIEHHTGAAARIVSQAGSALQTLHMRQACFLKSVHDTGGFCLEITARLATPYVSGLGGTHPTETGFILDRNTGLPYIPASGIKGVLRMAHSLNVAEAHPELLRQTPDGPELPDTEPSLRKYFGDTDTASADAVRGQLVFLDAFPASVPTMKKDIMNPHFGKYYDGTLAPVETENPIPVMFMSVQEGVDFKFRVVALPLAADPDSPVMRKFDDSDRAAILAMFKRAGEQLGFGAKTAVGYGRMGNTRDTSAELETVWRRIREEEEVRQFPWRPSLRELEAVANLGDFRQKGLEKDILIRNRSNPEVFKAVYTKAVTLRREWNAENRAKYDPLIAEWLQPSGLAWPPLEQSAATTINEAGAELERLHAITKWADYLAAPANLDILSKNGLKKLKEKLEGWGCKANDAKEDKKTMWAEVNRRLKS